MALAPAVWSYRQGTEWVPYALERGQQIEEGFCAFWRGHAAAPATIEFMTSLDQDVGSPCIIDFRTLEQISHEGGGESRCAIARQGAELRPSHSFLAPDKSSCSVLGAPQVQWGYGQDPVATIGFASYNASVNALLETAHAMYRAGSGLKGIVFTAGNKCDYLVDFESMMQTRIATRRVRPVFRHSVGVSLRTGVLMPAEGDVQVDTAASAQKSQDAPCNGTANGRGLLSAIPRPLQVARAGTMDDSPIRKINAAGVASASKMSRQERPQQTAVALRRNNEVLSSSQCPNAQSALARLARWACFCSM